jgi:hypothetical protein
MFLSEEPLGKGSWIASARKSYVDWIIRRIEPDTERERIVGMRTEGEQSFGEMKRGYPVSERCGNCNHLRTGRFRLESQPSTGRIRNLTSQQFPILPTAGVMFEF